MTGHSLQLHLNVPCYIKLLKYLFQKLQVHTEMFMYFTNYAQNSLSYIPSFSLPPMSWNIRKNNSVIQSCIWILQQREIAINISTVSCTVGIEYQFSLALNKQTNKLLNLSGKTHWTDKKLVALQTLNISAAQKLNSSCFIQAAGLFQK